MQQGENVELTMQNIFNGESIQFKVEVPEEQAEMFNKSFQTSVNNAFNGIM